MTVVRKLLLLAALAGACSASRHASAQVSAAQSAPSSASSRACTANPVLGGNAKANAAKKSKHPLPPEPLPACVEVKGEAIEVQEFLQSAVREFQWRIGENHASEDTWSFVRYLSEEDLEKYADTKVLLEPVKFTGGKVAVLVRTSEVSDGYVRVQITVHFEGEGKSTDKISGQPGTVWPLKSKGLLEQELISALQSRYKHVA